MLIIKQNQRVSSSFLNTGESLILMILKFSEAISVFLSGSDGTGQAFA